MTVRTQEDVVATMSGPGTLCDLFRATVAASPDVVALRRDDDDRELTWAAYAANVDAYATGLAAAGVGHGDVVGLLLRNVPEFHVADMAVLHLGAVPYSLYVTDTAEKMAGFVTAGDVAVLVTERHFLDRARELRAACPGLEHVLLVDGEDDDVRAIDDATAPDDLDLDARRRAVRPEDAAVLLYTSGSTGAPKGVLLSHRALRISVANYAAAATATPNGRVLSYLPHAHIADRFGSHYKALGYGHTITSVVDAATLYDTMRAVRPTDFFAVPRVLEKLWDRVATHLVGEPGGGDALAPRVAAVRDGVDPPRDGSFASARAAIGLDDAEWLTVGAAPSSRPILEQMHGIGLPFADIWGMTEIIVCTMGLAEARSIGTIGRPLGGVEFRLRPDGELLARGENAFIGYRGAPARTAEIRDADGWIHTGDLAAAGDHGLWSIVGRKKDVMINASGKNLSPTAIEGTIKATSPLIDQVVAVGDGRRYVAALIALDGHELHAYAAAHDLRGAFGDLAAEPAVLEEVGAAVERGNARLSRVEQVRRWHVVPSEWVPGGDEVSGGMKLARATIARKYADEIEALFTDG
jgi:long-chain acyl-CoA synthetase